MPDYVVRKGSRLAFASRIYEGGETVTLPAEQGDPLTEILEPAGQAATPSKAKSSTRRKRSGWTTTSDEDDESED